MKKIFKRFLAYAALAIVLGATVWADNDTDNRTDDQVTAFHSGIGAEMRLLELRISITKNILWGEKIVSAIKAKNASTDTTELETILAELNATRSQVASVNSTTGAQAATDFVDLKGDAINLTKEFREAARPLLKISEINSLKKGFSVIDWNEAKELASKLNQTRNEYNAKVLSDILSAMNISDPDLVEKLRDGKASPGQVKKVVKDSVTGLNKEQKKLIGLAVREETARRKVFVRAVADKVAYGRLNRTDERLLKKIDVAESMNLSDKVVEKLEKRKNNTETKMDRVVNKTEKKISRVENNTEKHIDRLENLSQKFNETGDKKIGKLEGRLNSSNLSDGKKEKLNESIGRVGNWTEKKQNNLSEKEDAVRNKGDRIVEALNKSIGGKKDD